MDIDYLHIYVDRVAPWQQWFIQHWGAQSPLQLPTRQPVPVQIGAVVLLLSDATQDAAAAAYLEQHPAGVGDVAFQVQDLDAIVRRFLAQGGELLHPIRVRQAANGRIRWTQIQGWAGLRHTLVERRGAARLLPGLDQPLSVGAGAVVAIDHAVLNVPVGDLPDVVAWYERALGFDSQQQFVIKTPYSGLYSRVLKHPQGEAKLPVNEPATPNSQVQEFLNWHRGAGVQHAALLTTDILTTVGDLRQRGVSFLEVPNRYYEQVPERPGFWHQGVDLEALQRQQILVDWAVDVPQARLLQTFTGPVFGIPTLFFELIERQQIYQNGQPFKAEGFGEGNFQALFEAMEREQVQRGSLQCSSEENR